ncbi:homocysteine S-methyltransferase family protein [Nocardioides euryhalodurans]|uniref:Homocysteine S-methyltransferase n=1 Tax=Nocardioides euryhalodurans TaxID=2518370 RepID=A0A4P7GGZ6_9ACTN|nr:homocysteine S-methyltransferase family protein [Nocardioides euryhalodurans]QBR91001.1 homocysteine S-methyltransferase [Nocardioides euryhalodurans]
MPETTTSASTTASPLLAQGPFVTDGGLETDLLFHHGFELPEFASFPLLEDAAGRNALDAYYDQYAEIAAAAGQGLMLETPTWRANPDWADRIGYDAVALDRANRSAVALVRRAQERSGLERTLVVGDHGPRGDGYVAGQRVDADEMADYHAVQARSFAAEGVDLIHAMTMTTPEEGIGVVRAARSVGVPVAVSFTVETDGRLPDGTPLRDAVVRLDAEAAPDWFGVNCAHPTHLAPALDGGAWQQRIASVRPNASTMTHEELDAMEELDEGDLDLLTSSLDGLRGSLPALAVVGGCCGTDARHVAALWGV